MTIEGLQRSDGLDDSTWDALETLGRALHVEDSDPQATLDAILLAAKSSVEGTDFVGVNLTIGDRFEPQAVLGEPPTQLDALQQRTGVGPCIDAAREQRVIRVDDVRDAPLWPQYSDLALSLGVQSMLCTPMQVDEVRLGSISLYSCSPAAFGVHAERVAGLLGLHAAIALSETRRRENLTLALHNRDVIGQAKGILMERHRITADAAFSLLSQASQQTNRKLAVIAEQVASTGVLDA